MERQDGAGGVANVAKEQAGQVGQTAADAGGQVAQTTKEQAGAVVGEVRQQARDLAGEARTQVSSQAGAQKGRAVEGLRTLADELNQMAEQGGQSGVATEVARQAASRAQGLADHLDRHEPSDLLDQVRSYARRRPVAFLAGAAVLGVLAGRMTRGLTSSDDSGSGQQAAYGGDSYRGVYGDTGVGVAGQSAAYEPGWDAAPGGFRPAGEPVPAYGNGYATGQDGYTTGQPGYGTGQTESGYATGEPAYQAEPGYQAGYQPEPGYQAGYQPEPGYQAGYQPGSTHEPEPGYEAAPEETFRRNP
jgi:hypothetical protein